MTDKNEAEESFSSLLSKSILFCMNKDFYVSSDCHNSALVLKQKISDEAHFAPAPKSFETRA